VGNLTGERVPKFQWQSKVWERVRRGLDPRECGQNVADHVSSRRAGAVPLGHLPRSPKRVWHRGLEGTQFGQFSLAMYEANYVMEDAVEVLPGTPRQMQLLHLHSHDCSTVSSHT